MSEKHVLEIEAKLQKIIWLQIKNTVPDINNPFFKTNHEVMRMVLGPGYRNFVVNTKHFSWDFKLDDRIRNFLDLKKSSWCTVSGTFPNTSQSSSFSSSPLSIRTIFNVGEIWHHFLVLKAEAADAIEGETYAYRRLKTKLASSARMKLLEEDVATLQDMRTNLDGYYLELLYKFNTTGDLE